MKTESPLGCRNPRFRWIVYSKRLEVKYLENSLDSSMSKGFAWLDFPYLRKVLTNTGIP